MIVVLHVRPGSSKEVLVGENSPLVLKMRLSSHASDLHSLEKGD